MHRFIIYFVLLATICLIHCDERGCRVRRIVGGEPAPVPPYDDPVIYTRFNGKTARVEGVRAFPHYVFRGIKYAHPPVGPDRFLRPREKFLEGIVNATTFAPPCIQPVPGENRIIGNEDCLALNIFTPDLPTGTEGYPVVVWIHGGGFRYGSASQYGVRHLVGKRLIIVTSQYRLGSLGFLSLGTKDMPGNAGLWDIALALQWVKNYIGFFGGNPHRIILMGHDSGASNALMVSLSKISKGLTSGIIAMSGTAVSQWATDDTPMKSASDVAKQNGCPTVSHVTMVKCLQKVPAESIIRGDSNIEHNKINSNGFIAGLTGRLGVAPCSEGLYDGRSLPALVENDPAKDMYEENNPKIPLLTGITKDETKKAVEGHFKGDIVQKLQSVPNFLNTFLVERLQSHLKKVIQVRNLTKGLTQGLTESLVPNQSILNFNNYLQTKKNTVQENLNKVAEVTGDALFNVPAFLTANLWNGAPAYLYRFEHSGRLKKGYDFLKGMAIIGNNSQDEQDNVVGHGDELAYLFEPHDLEGNPLETEESSEDDVKVREIFTQMIADFARFGKPTINNQEVSPFSATKNNFVQITTKPTLASDFRYCEIALWVNIVDRLKSTTCSFLKAFDATLSNVQQSVLDTIDKTGLNIQGGLTNKGLLGNPISSNKNKRGKMTSDRLGISQLVSSKNQQGNSPLGGILG